MCPLLCDLDDKISRCLSRVFVAMLSFHFTFSQSRAVTNTFSCCACVTTRLMKCPFVRRNSSGLNLIRGNLQYPPYYTLLPFLIHLFFFSLHRHLCVDTIVFDTRLLIPKSCLETSSPGFFRYLVVRSRSKR